MSHYTCMVIGPDPEGQLAPFDENMEVEPYLDEDGDKTTYNPNSKWDWYVLGGRWRGSLLLKPGCAGVVGGPGTFGNSAEPGRADQAHKGDIDLDGMRLEAMAKAADRWERISAVLDGREIPTPVHRDLDLSDPRFNVEKAKYFADPVIVELKADESLIGWGEWADEVVEGGRDGMVYRARLGAVPSYAMLADGAWMAPGRMGWFGYSSDDATSRTAYLEKANRIIDGLPDETLLSVFDLHI